MSSQLDNPKTWATGGDPPTEKQTSFLQTLAKEKNVEIEPEKLNKGDASAKINELKNMNTVDADATADEPIQDPKTWATGDDAATGKQTGYIAVMAKEAGEDVKTQGMGKSEASEEIGRLKEKTGM